MARGWKQQKSLLSKVGDPRSKPGGAMLPPEALGRGPSCVFGDSRSPLACDLVTAISVSWSLVLPAPLLLRLLAWGYSLQRSQDVSSPGP